MGGMVKLGAVVLVGTLAGLYATDRFVIKYGPNDPTGFVEYDGTKGLLVSAAVVTGVVLVVMVAARKLKGR